MTIVAHAGHRVASLAYAAPVVILGGFMGWTKLRDRRQRRQAT